VSVAKETMQLQHASLWLRSQERSQARMNKPKPRRSIERPGSSAVRAAGTTAVLAAVIMAIRRRSRSTTYAQGEPGEGRGEGAKGYRGDAIQSPLIGHEFRLFGDRFRMLESARETEDESLLAEYFARHARRSPSTSNPIWRSDSRWSRERWVSEWEGES